MSIHKKNLENIFKTKIKNNYSELADENDLLDKINFDHDNDTQY